MNTDPHPQPRNLSDAVDAALEELEALEVRKLALSHQRRRQQLTASTEAPAAIVVAIDHRLQVLRAELDLLDSDAAPYVLPGTLSRQQRRRLERELRKQQRAKR